MSHMSKSLHTIDNLNFLVTPINLSKNKQKDKNNLKNRSYTSNDNATASVKSFFFFLILSWRSQEHDEKMAYFDYPYPGLSLRN